jgi:hypothetical protein
MKILRRLTVTAGQTASIGAIYSNNGKNFTVETALTSDQTSVVISCTNGHPIFPSGTMVHVSGTGTGPIAYSKVSSAILKH